MTIGGLLSKYFFIDVYLESQPGTVYTYFKYPTRQNYLNSYFIDVNFKKSNEVKYI
jgi:hypothetical protein